MRPCCSASGMNRDGSASSWKRTNFDLHNVLGFYSSLVMLFITLSGVLIAFENVTDPLVRRLNPPAPEAPAPQSTPVAGGTRIPIDEAIAIAERALPGAVRVERRPSRTARKPCSAS